MTLLSQNEISITGYIYDADTNKPLPYVNIGFVDEGVGTVTDDNGRFNLQFNPNALSPNSILQISYIGYKTIRMASSAFFVAISKDNTFYLQPEPYDLDEIVLTNDLRKEAGAGSLGLNRNIIGYWLNAEALGGEIATRFPIDKEKTKLHELKFYLVKNNSGRIKVRVNVYEYKDGLPGKNLLSQNIYHTITTKTGVENINLEPYNIYVDSDIVVSLELIKVNGNYIDFQIGGSYYKTNSFTKMFSQDKWKLHYGTSLAMTLRTSYPSPHGKVIAKKRTLPKRITLYWDTSLSMGAKGRDIEKELDLLEKYLKTLKRVDIKVIKFSTKISQQGIFSIDNGRTNPIREYLFNSNYEGEASFSEVLKTNEFESDVAILFSNAKTLFEPLEQSVYLPTFCINSMESADHSRLQTASFYGDGQYINLSKVSVKESLEMMLSEFNDTDAYEDLDYLGLGGISGTVMSDSLVVSRASIRVKNSLVETVSDNNGHFSLDAKQGDVLMINALGMLDKEVLIQRERNIEVNLIADGTLLDEVTLYGKKKQEEEMVLTPYGVKSKNSIGYSMSELDEEDIKSSYQTLDQVIAKIPGVLISGVGKTKRYSIIVNMGSSAVNDANPIIVIDDIIYHQENGLETLPPIDIQQIKSIRVLKSVVGTNRYGSAGAYGAIEIRTQATSINKNGNTQKKEDVALVKGNDYVEEGIPLLDAASDMPNYIKELQKATTFEEARSIYNDQKSRMPLAIPYILDVSDYFNKWDRDFAYIVLTNIAAIASKNVKALKTLVFKLEETQHFDTAKLVYERIAKLRPNDAQSYRDLANIYQETGDYDKAMDLYKQILSNSIKGVDFTGLQQPIIDELMHLLAFHRSKVDYSDLPTDFLTAGFKQDIRIVFEWNDPSAEFELQFVNPQKKFFKWSHTKLDNRERMLDEIKKGYATMANIIDDAEAGEWMINIEALNESPSINPNYLKYTIYKNYGLANETKTVKVIQLQSIKQKVTLDKFMYQ